MNKLNLFFLILLSSSIQTIRAAEGIELVVHENMDYHTQEEMEKFEPIKKTYYEKALTQDQDPVEADNKPMDISNILLSNLQACWAQSFKAYFSR